MTTIPNKKLSRAKKFAIGVWIFLLFIIAIIIFSPETPEQKAEQKGKTEQAAKPLEEKRSPERNLATLDAGADVAENDIRTNAIRNYLETLSSRYGESTDTIAEYCSRCQGVLYDKGVQVSCKEILSEFLAAAPTKKGLNIKIRDVAVLYLMVKSQPQ